MEVLEVGKMMVDCLEQEYSDVVAVEVAKVDREQVQKLDYHWHCSEMWLDLGSVDYCSLRCRLH